MEAEQCFVCAYAGEACARPSVEGKLKRIFAPAGRKMAPTITVEEPDGAYLAISLTSDDYVLAQRLLELPESGWRDIRVRIWHLFQSASQDGAQTLRASAATLIVVEPDMLLNITDLNAAEQCARQFPLRRMVPSAPNGATIRGNVVHRAFQEMVKTQQDDPTGPLETALSQQAVEMGLRGLSEAQMRDDAMPHLSVLASWMRAQKQTLWRTDPHFHTETFLLAPALGIRGRMDFLMRDAHGESLIELKTGNAQGQLPRRSHRWQVYGYHALLASRNLGSVRHPQATLLYSGTPGHAEAHRIPFTPRDLRRVVELRNQLAIIAATGIVPKPPGAGTCERCYVRQDCSTASAVLGWEPPEVVDAPQPVESSVAASITAWHEMLRLEARAADDDVAALWRLKPSQRAEAGTGISQLSLRTSPERTLAGEWRYEFATRETSDLREGDQVLVSDGDPITGEVVMGTIEQVYEGGLRLWTPEPIERPTQIDRYSSDIVNDRTQQNLWRWLSAEPRLQALVAGEIEPRFSGEAAPECDGLNDEQRMAVTQALRARDYLLVRGPPGTGKTSVVAHIVREAVARGERVLLAAFTNQALDNALRRVLEVGVTSVVRLGHDYATADDLRDWRLVARATVLSGLDEREPLPGEVLRETLLQARVIASTAATWASSRYDDLGDLVRADLAIIDEASQLTTPALLGALRFAGRFVLVGDERQLPPLVRSEGAALLGLGESLFTRLSACWDGQATVSLTRQYRMHPVICAFPSDEFYGGVLRAAGQAETALLSLLPTAPSLLQEVLLPERPVVFVDVRAVPEERQGKASAAQAEVAAKIARMLRHRGVPPEEIGVIAPYRAQVAAIRKRLEATGESGITVDTVDRFQGAERSVIIFSFGGDAGTGQRARDFLADPHRLNVALTRAKHKLILLGSREALDRVPLVRRLVRYAAGLYAGHGGLARVDVRTGVEPDVLESATNADSEKSRTSM